MPPVSKVFGTGVAKAGVNRVNAIVPGFFPAERVAGIMTHTDGWSDRVPGLAEGVVCDGGFGAMTI